jgi:hypothetical protein
MTVTVDIDSGIIFIETDEDIDLVFDHLAGFIALLDTSDDADTK